MRVQRVLKIRNRIVEATAGPPTPLDELVQFAVLGLQHKNDIDSHAVPIPGNGAATRVT